MPRKDETQAQRLRLAQLGRRRDEIQVKIEDLQREQDEIERDGRILAAAISAAAAPDEEQEPAPPAEVK